MRLTFLFYYFIFFYFLFLLHISKYTTVLNKFIFKVMLHASSVSTVKRLVCIQCEKGTEFGLTLSRDLMTLSGR